MKQFKIVVFTALLAGSLIKPNQAAPEKAAPSQAAKTSKVFVVGNVQKPGAYSFSSPLRLLDAIVSAGGMNAKPESLRLSVLRGSKELPVNMAGLLSMKDDQNLLLQSGDVVMLAAADSTDEPTVPPQWLNPSSEPKSKGLGKGGEFYFNGEIIRIVPLSKNRVTQKQK
jgi:hypothetical protein